MVRATIVVENMCQQQGLLAEWGYSVHLETPSGNLLWDTGGYLHVLEHNLRFLGIDTNAIDHVALSHSHFDHMAGLMDVLRLCPRARYWGGEALKVQRWADADQARNGGGGPVFERLNYTSVDP
ncbi:MAG: MBL fold metallo-hydrolase, partial [Burkholderiaceae bacterium]|nr:MBL fold metallo-hydrolase [Burkholderiaceae bacterium]